MRKNLSIILTLLATFLCTISVSAQQAYGLRLLNHWDNPDGTIERGFAGQTQHLLDSWQTSQHRKNKGIRQDKSGNRHQRHCAQQCKR